MKIKSLLKRKTLTSVAIMDAYMMSKMRSDFEDVSNTLHTMKRNNNNNEYFNDTQIKVIDRWFIRRTAFVQRFPETESPLVDITLLDKSMENLYSRIKLLVNNFDEFNRYHVNDRVIFDLIEDSVIIRGYLKSICKSRKSSSESLPEDHEQLAEVSTTEHKN